MSEKNQSFSLRRCAAVYDRRFDSDSGEAHAKQSPVFKLVVVQKSGSYEGGS